MYLEIFRLKICFEMRSKCKVKFEFELEEVKKFQTLFGAKPQYA